MKKKLLRLCFVATLIIVLACAFKIDENASIKELTHPYINTYECTRATLGETDLLDEYEYFRIRIGENDKLKILFKKRGGKTYEYESTYKFDEKTRELTAEIAIFGFTYRHKTTIENGKFVISMPILSKPLIIIFEVK